MRQTLIFAVFLLCTVTLPQAREEAELKNPVGKLTPRPEGPEWTDLLALGNMHEWRSNIKALKNFKIEDGALHIFGTQSGAHVGFMKERLKNFELHIEFKTSPKANSGVVIGGEPDDPLFTGMEIQVFEDHGGPATVYSCGALYGVATPMFNMSFPAGEWNSFDITFNERTLVVVMNGWKILDIDLSKMTMPVGKFPTPYAELALDGYLFVQDNTGEAWYRNVMLKKL